jgi:hypothetical protein
VQELTLCEDTARDGEVVRQVEHAEKHPPVDRQRERPPYTPVVEEVMAAARHRQHAGTTSCSRVCAAVRDLAKAFALSWLRLRAGGT